ncbi:hypothetical protein ABBQ38_002330 [Trebouxia sp. C0009 RCD-2024]
MWLWRIVALLFSWKILFLLVFGPNLLAYLTHQLLLGYYCKDRDLQRRYNAQWGLVTGASSGIGKALALRMADQGINVVLVAKPDNLLDETYAEMQGIYKHLQIRKVAVDLSESGKYLEPIAEATKDIDVQLIFNNAGYMLTGFFERWALKDHLQNIECNSTSAVAITHHFLSQMIDKKLKGCIVFTSSAAACIPSPFGVTYAATKSFLSSFGASLAPEVKASGIDVMVAHPSPVASRFYNGAHGLSTLQMFQKLGVPAEELPSVIFSGIGRTVHRDIGPTAVLFRLLVKWLDYNLFACIICYIAPWMTDYKQAQTQESKRKPVPMSNGSNLK